MNRSTWVEVGWLALRGACLGALTALSLAAVILAGLALFPAGG